MPYESTPGFFIMLIFKFKFEGKFCILKFHFHFKKVYSIQDHRRQKEYKKLDLMIPTLKSEAEALK